MKTLEGIRVLDLSHVIAGPFASYQLALLGAEVIRVDRIDALDFIRFHGGTNAMKDKGLGASYIAQNAGKSCIQLNLKDPRGTDLAKRLAATSDVLLENFRPGVVDSLGLGYADIRECRPDVIYCSLTGYGQTGPLRDAPAYDHIVQGFAGLMSLTGTAEAGPTRMGTAITDYLAGINAAFAMTSALLHRERTGEGQYLDVSMLASALTTMGAAIADYQTTGKLPPRRGNQPFSDSPFAGRFETADGYIVVTANTPAQTKSMVAALSINTVADELARLEAGEPLTAHQKQKIATVLQDTFKTKPATDWEAELSAASVPAGKVRDVGELLDHPQTAAIGTMDDIAAEGRSTAIRIPGLAFTARSSQATELPPPEIAGQSTINVLRKLALSEGEMQELARAGVIAGAGLPEQD